MFQPPDSRVPVVTFTAPKAATSLVRWAVFVGILFGVVRFSVGVVFIFWMVEPNKNLGGALYVPAEVAWLASIAASTGAGLVGGIMFWRLRKQRITKFQGATVGVMAAFGSYVSIAVCVGAVFGAFNGVTWGALSAMITGIVTIPVLAILGMVLSSMQRASSIPEPK